MPLSNLTQKKLLHWGKSLSFYGTLTFEAVNGKTLVSPSWSFPLGRLFRFPYTWRAAESPRPGESLLSANVKFFGDWAADRVSDVTMFWFCLFTRSGWVWWSVREWKKKIESVMHDSRGCSDRCSLLSSLTYCIQITDRWKTFRVTKLEREAKTVTIVGMTRWARTPRYIAVSMP